MRDSPSPNFSVVIPLFNKEQSITRCVNSVLQQTYPAAEIIIVNDGSTDNSLAVAQKLTDPKIRLLAKPNGGVSAARNDGMALAKYEFVTLLDADDEWSPVFLEKLASLIQKFPGAGLYYSAHEGRKGAKKMGATTVPSLPLHADSLVNMFNLNTDQGPSSSSVVLRKNLLPRTGLFDPKLAKGEDIDLWIRFALNGPVAIHNASLSICHQDGENNAMNKPCAPDRSLINNLDRYTEAARNNLEFAGYLRQMRVAHICNFLGGNPCELVDPHQEIDHLDLSRLSSIWTYIRQAPRPLRRPVFLLHIYWGSITRRLGRLVGTPAGVK
jgi:glycosyltransferase involved in cell wall biosynthesis